MAFSGYDFPAYVPAAQRRANAKAEAKRLSKGGRALRPVEIEGRKIAQTFWGKAWCDHIETFGDFASRLPRGRTYARNGYVIDLQLEPGKVRAQVMGSELYSASIDIAPLAKPQWKALVKQCAGQIESVVELLSGELSDGVLQLLVEPTKGLFPASAHLELDCSCPDPARLCKHLAAVLYGIGNRLDAEPELFFVLRGVDQLELIDSASKGGVLGKKKSKVKELASDDLSDIFGIELENAPAPAPAVSGRSKRGRSKKTKT